MTPNDNTHTNEPLKAEELIRGSPERVAFLKDMFEKHHHDLQEAFSQEALEAANQSLLDSATEAIKPPWEE